jgi:ribonuclease BN (tRNA processing enzyme)
MRHVHPVETYGLQFVINGVSIGLLVDTGYTPELSSFYKTEVLIIGVVFDQPRPGIDHLSLPEVEMIVDAVKPKKTVLTHFGMSMLKAKPHVQTEAMSRRLGREVVAAYDGMTLQF